MLNSCVCRLLADNRVAIVSVMGDYKRLPGEQDSIQARPKNDPIRQAELNTPESGLSSAEAHRRLVRDG